jgi:hypothetical protein
MAPAATPVPGPNPPHEMGCSATTAASPTGSHVAARTDESLPPRNASNWGRSDTHQPIAARPPPGTHTGTPMRPRSEPSSPSHVHSPVPLHQPDPRQQGSPAPPPAPAFRTKPARIAASLHADRNSPGAASPPPARATTTTSNPSRNEGPNRTTSRHRRRKRLRSTAPPRRRPTATATRVAWPVGTNRTTHNRPAHVRPTRNTCSRSDRRRRRCIPEPALRARLPLGTAHTRPPVAPSPRRRTIAAARAVAPINTKSARDPLPASPSAPFARPVCASGYENHASFVPSDSWAEKYASPLTHPQSKP